MATGNGPEKASGPREYGAKESSAMTGSVDAEYINGVNMSWYM